MIEIAHLPSLADSSDHYLRVIKKIPILSEEEEKVLSMRFWKDGDLDAAKKLVLSHLRFVVYIARSYLGYGLPQADLIQEGNIGLMKAVKRFNPEIGVRLVSFAVHWIRAEIHAYVLKNWRIVKIATTKAQRKLFFNLRKSKKKLENFTVLERSDIAQGLGVSPEEVAEMEARLAHADLPLDASPEGEEHSETPASSLHALLEDHRSNFSKQIEAQNWEHHTNRCLANAVDELKPREKHIIKARWLEEPRQTLQTLAAFYKISPERVRQIEQNALKQLKLAILPQLDPLQENLGKAV